VQPVAERIAERARALGFHAVGFAPADEPLDEDHARYLAFVAAGRHGEMGYLADNAETRRRLDAATILAGARTVVCLARRYGRGAEEEGDPPLARTIARYARGRDYHGHLRKRLERLAAFVRGLGRGVRARALCDTAPVLERAWAARAGLGFIGKNGLLIVPGQGSYVLLGEVVTTLDVGAGAHGERMAERCGACTRCLDACPTGAFVAPFVLDPRRCISYVTIEGRSVPPEPLRGAVGEHLFGCDDCQEACPYNRVPPPPPADRVPYRPLARWSELSLTDLVALDEPGWRVLAHGTPLRRATRVGLARNAVLVAAGRARAGDAAARDALERACARGEAPVRALAAEALGRLG
jgi:epoxyqueuosine reductase